MLNSNQRRPSVIRLVAYRRCGGGGGGGGGIWAGGKCLIDFLGGRGHFDREALCSGFGIYWYESYQNVIAVLFKRERSTLFHVLCFFMKIQLLWLNFALLRLAVCLRTWNKDDIGLESASFLSFLHWHLLLRTCLHKCLISSANYTDIEVSTV